MSVFTIEGKRIGTFEAKAGDQLSMSHGKGELIITDSYRDEDGDPVVELTARVRQPVDEVRIECELPDHGIDKLIEMLEEERERLR